MESMDDVLTHAGQLKDDLKARFAGKPISFASASIQVAHALLVEEAEREIQIESEQAGHKLLEKLPRKTD